MWSNLGHTHTHLAPRAQGVAVHTQTHIWYQSKQSSVYIWKWTQSDLSDQFRCPLRVHRHTVPLTSVHLKADGWHIRAARLSVFYKRVFRECVFLRSEQRESWAKRKQQKENLLGPLFTLKYALKNWFSFNKVIRLNWICEIHDQDCTFSSLFLSFSLNIACGKACYVGFSPDHVHFLGV